MNKKIIIVHLFNLFFIILTISCSDDISNDEIRKEQFCRGYINDIYMDARIIIDSLCVNEITRLGESLSLVAFTDNSKEGGWLFYLDNIDLEYITLPCIISMLDNTRGYYQCGLFQPYPQMLIWSTFHGVSDTIISDKYFYLMLDDYSSNYLRGRFVGSFPLADSTYKIEEGEFCLKITRTYIPELAK